MGLFLSTYNLPEPSDSRVIPGLISPPSPFHFPFPPISALSRLPHLALTVSSCVSFGPILTRHTRVGPLLSPRYAIYLCPNIWASTQSCHGNVANLRKL